MEISNEERRSAQFIISFIKENNGLQRTLWQRKYFEKKPRFPYKVPQTAAETDTPSPLDRQ